MFDRVSALDDKPHKNIKFLHKNITLDKEIAMLNDELFFTDKTSPDFRMTSSTLFSRNLLLVKV